MTAPGPAERLLAGHDVTSVEDVVRAAERGVDAYFAMLERDPDRWLRMLTADDPPALRPEAADAAAHALSGVAEQLGRWWLRHPDVPRARVVGWFRDVLGSGVGTLVTSTPSEVPP